jgi:hypothetical protein
MGSMTDFSGVLDDSMELAQSAGRAQAVSSSKFSTSTRDASDDIPGSLTSAYRSTTPKLLSGGSVSPGSITGGETSFAFFAAKATPSKESPTATLGAHQKKGNSDPGLLNKDDYGANGPTPELSSVNNLVPASASLITQNIARSEAPNALRAPSAGSLDFGAPVTVAGQTVTSQLTAGSSTSYLYPATSDAETTAFAIALTPTSESESGTLERDPGVAGPLVVPSYNQVQASTVGKAMVPQQSGSVSTGSSATDDSDSESTADPATRIAQPGSFGPEPAGSQNSPSLVSTEESSQKGAAMDRNKPHSEGFVGVASESVDRSISDPTNDSPMSSSKAIQPMESHEMHVPGAPKTDLTVRIQGDAGQSVNLRVVERAGQIQVSVRTNDPVTAALLRREVPALQTGLERIGWHANPITPAIQPPSEARSSDEQTHSQHQNAEQKSQSDPQQQQQRPRSGAADQWLELMYRQN